MSPASLLDKTNMPSRVFTCPATRVKVQHWVDGDEDVPDNEYEAITCQACSRIHLVNRKTGEVLGQQEDR